MKINLIEKLINGFTRALEDRTGKSFSSDILDFGE